MDESGSLNTISSQLPPLYFDIDLLEAIWGDCFRILLELEPGFVGTIDGVLWGVLFDRGFAVEDFLEEDMLESGSANCCCCCWCCCSTAFKAGDVNGENLDAWWLCLSSREETDVVGTELPMYGVFWTLPWGMPDGPMKGVLCMLLVGITIGETIGENTISGLTWSLDSCSLSLCSISEKSKLKLLGDGPDIPAGVKESWSNSPWDSCRCSSPLCVACGSFKSACDRWSKSMSISLFPYCEASAHCGESVPRSLLPCRWVFK